MRCPFCHSELPAALFRCPSCGRDIATQSSNSQAVEPELVEPDASFPVGGSPFSSGSKGFVHGFYTTFSSGNTLSAGCTPTLVTLMLTLIITGMYGLLAGIGFLVFTAVGRVITFFLTVRHILEGRRVNPWFLHILIWMMCWLLVAWLSGNLS